jgi:hypothetical protein
MTSVVDCSLYVFNYNTDSWEYLVKQTTNVMTTMSAVRTSGFTNYVDGNGYIHILAEGTMNANIGTDYIQLNITEKGEDENPKSIALTIGQSTTFNWSINATGQNNSLWEIGIFANSSYGSTNIPNNSSNVTLCTGACPSGPAGTANLVNISESFNIGTDSGRQYIGTRNSHVLETINSIVQRLFKGTRNSYQNFNILDYQFKNYYTFRGFYDTLTENDYASRLLVLKRFSLQSLRLELITSRKLTNQIITFDAVTINGNSIKSMYFKRSVLNSITTDLFSYNSLKLNRFVQNSFSIQS